YVEAARVLAQQVLQSSKPIKDGKIDRGIVELYRRVLLRDPSSKELELLQNVYQRHLAHYRTHPKLADQVLHVGLSPLAAGLAADELAAWTSLARVILNLHETITRS
ncbi:MAG: peptidylprolyl isomerase, partial [Planctomycetaceae bacterium]